ncbi:MAG: hypothetical protein CMJ95_11335 [Planctomycetes bacterium]|nr:hypothetical protein [Planctomycetota bacterium]
MSSGPDGHGFRITGVFERWSSNLTLRGCEASWEAFQQFSSTDCLPLPSKLFLEMGWGSFPKELLSLCGDGSGTRKRTVQLQQLV